jgi:hypothetical protein
MNPSTGVALSPRGRALSLAFACVWLANSLLAAEVSIRHARTVSSTGLFTLHPGHSMALTLVETGGSAARSSAVVLELVDSADAVIARFQGELLPGRPVGLTFDTPPPQGVAIRARVRVSTPIENLASAPILTLEVWNDQTLDSFAIATCRMRYDPKGSSGEVLGDCGGCETSTEIAP